MPYKDPAKNAECRRNYYYNNKEKIAEQKKEYNQRPEVRQRHLEYLQNYYSNPVNIERKRQYGKTEKYKEQRKVYISSPRGRFAQQKAAAKRRNIEWQLAFEEWWKIWQNSGKWEERKQGGYFMCRFGDTGPYSEDNVYIADIAQNNKDKGINKKRANSSNS